MERVHLTSKEIYAGIQGVGRREENFEIMSRIDAAFGYIAKGNTL